MAEQLANFQSLHKSATAGSSASDLAAAKEAWERFASFDFPKGRHEEWKYTNVRQLFTAPYVMHAQNSVANVAESSSEPKLFADALTLSFVDGALASKPAQQLAASGVVVARLSSMPKNCKQHFVDLQAASFCSAPSFAYLNQAVNQDPLCIYVSRAQSVPGLSPLVHLQFIATDEAKQQYQAPSILLVVDSGAKLTIVETYEMQSSDAGLNYFVNPLVRCQLLANSVCEHVKLIKDGLHARHIANKIINLADHSAYHSFHAMLGGKLVRDDLTVNILGKHASAELSGVYLGTGKQHQDSHCSVEHTGTHGSSNQFYRGILAQNARGVFDSKVIVDVGAIKSNSQQTNNNLLLSELAEVDTKPELQIYNDDVACKHGATIGELEHEQLFYLQSRGLTIADAKLLLTTAFVNEVVQKIRHEVINEWMQDVVAGHLQQVILSEAVNV